MADSALAGAGALCSSDFEFSITLSPSKHSAAHLCPADELFYKGQLLPLHLSPRLSLVRALLLSSPSTSSSDATSTTPSRHSNGSSSSSADYSDSPRPSSVTEQDTASASKRGRRYFSSFTARFSSFFRGNKKMINKYAEKVKPLREKLAALNKRKTFCLRRTEMFASAHTHSSQSLNGSVLRSPCRRKSAASCPPSMRSSPSHSGLLCSDLPSASSMEELQSAIQAAIAHCKSTMAKQKKTGGMGGSSFEDDLLCVS